MKNVYCIRHGTAEHNELFREIGEEAYMSIQDSSLTEQGNIESLVLGDSWIQKNNIELVLVSPLTRTIETAKNIFKNTTVKMFALDDLKEFPGSYEPINHRKNKKELVLAHHPSINFKYLTETDPLWDENEIETIESLEERVKKTKDFILSRKENEIAIVSHNSFLSYFLNKTTPETDSELKHCFPYNIYIKSNTSYL